MKNICKNVSSQLKKIIASRHPVAETTKNLITLKQKRGFALLVFAKAIGVSPLLLNKHGPDIVAQVFTLQHKLSDVTEMMYSSHILHNGVLNFDVNCREKQKDEKTKEMHAGNVLSVLIGDQLLVNASRGLAELREPIITEWMSQALEDLSKYGFFVTEKVDESSSDSVMKNIEQRCMFSGGSLLANAYKSAALLAGYSINENKSFFNSAYDMGKHVGITFQLEEMLNCTVENFNLGKSSKHDVLNYVKKLLEVHVQTCLHLVDTLTKSESRSNLRNIVISIGNKNVRQHVLEQRLS